MPFNEIRRAVFREEYACWPDTLGLCLCELLSRPETPEGSSTRMIELLTLAAELTWPLRGRVWRASSRRAHHGLRRSRPPRAHGTPVSH